MERALAAAPTENASLRSVWRRLGPQEVTVPDVSTEGVARPVVITLPKERCTEPVVERLKSVLESHPGVTDVHLRLIEQQRKELWRVGQNLRVTSSPALSADLKALLGPSCLSA